MSKNNIKQWAYIVAGSLLLAAGFVFFITPYHIVPGGVYGMGVVLNYLLPSIDVGTFGLALDIPSLIISLKIFGAKIGSKTITAALLTPLFMNSMTWIIGDTNPATMLGGAIDLSDDKLLACIFGGALVGLALSLIMRTYATSGGTDIVAMIISKYIRIPISRSLLYVDSAVVLFGLVAIADWKIPLYSLVTIFVATRILDFMLEEGSQDKLLFIVSKKHEQIRDFILEELVRGGTYIKSTGMYTDSPREMIFVVISRQELSRMQDFVRDTDSDAFMIVVNAHETLGDGFKTFHDRIGG